MSKRLDSFVVADLTILRRRLRWMNDSFFLEHLMWRAFGKMTWLVVPTCSNRVLSNWNVRSAARIRPLSRLLLSHRERLRLAVELTVRLLLFCVLYFGDGVQDRWPVMIRRSACLLIVYLFEFWLQIVNFVLQTAQICLHLVELSSIRLVCLFWFFLFDLRFLQALIILLVCGLIKLFFSNFSLFMVDLAKKSLLKLSIGRKLVLIHVIIIVT